MSVGLSLKNMHSTLNRRSYLWWIAVCAIPPLLKAIGVAGIEYEFETFTGNRKWLTMVADFILPATYYLLLVAATHRALRQFVPHLTLGRWLTVMAASFVLYALSFGIGIFPLHLQPTDWDESVRGSADWTTLIHVFMANSLCYVLLPACVLGQLSRIRWNYFLAAGLATGITTFLVSALAFGIISESPILHAIPLTPMVSGITDALAGALGATVGCLVLAALVRHDDASIRLRDAGRWLACAVAALIPWLAMNVAPKRITAWSAPPTSCT